ncbi:PAS domain-containing protein [Pseudomonas sp. CDFA 602]|uniref:hybrid sensor histidine kinase/response regulator n=1 Tax=Pseudomonas californiensis TaxID=2829823 RepID=UPI001E55F8E4|nr:PAS domain-containing protein [Pseudomonas californiensis]MCD5992850.1 PAS domain-containing protein [Pseudomonas californiensis]MCD5998730.1 PAS domain-containing protein [Pseudomonas californiensis]
MTPTDIPDLQSRFQALEAENAQLRERLSINGQKAQDALALSQERYRFLFDAMDEGFCIIEFFDGPHGSLSDYIHIEANPAYEFHAGIPNVVGKKLREMVREEADGWVEFYGKVLHTGQPVRFERELEATGRYLALTAFRIEPASRRQVAVLFQDITERKRAELALKQLNETLEARIIEAVAERKVFADVVNGTNAFIHVIDFNYRWIAINGSAAREFERLFGVRPKVGDNMLELLKNRPESKAALEQRWAQALAGEEFAESASFSDSNDPSRHFEIRYSTLRNAEGQAIGAYLFAYDVSERRREQDRLGQAEEALRQSQKMEAVGQLTGGIAHDFNNLLTGITGSLELLKARLSQGRFTEIDRYVAAAQDASKRAASLTHRLLAFSRRQTLDPKPVDINRLVVGMEELIRRTVGPHITVEVVTSVGMWSTFIDAPQLENALLNLCINARDAMPRGGRITIETANKWIDQRASESRDLSPGQYLALCVSDTGTGMSPEVMNRAFDPFFTTKPLGQGTGLGLSMVYGFVRQSGGQVRIYSEPDQGTTMCLYLPRHYVGAPEETADAECAQAVPTLSAQTVMIVDDEPTIRMLVSEVLEDQGYIAIEAGEGASALRVLESDARIDLLVTDVGLPGGMNGRQLADAARVLRPGLKVLFITGYAENAIIGNGHLDPGMWVLTKPFTMEAFASRIYKMIDAED